MVDLTAPSTPRIGGSGSSGPLPGTRTAAYIGAPADRVIGQPRFNSRQPNYEGVTARSLSLKGSNNLSSVIGGGASVTSGGVTTLWFPDRVNSRVLRYDVTPWIMRAIQSASGSSCSLTSGLR